MEARFPPRFIYMKYLRFEFWCFLLAMASVYLISGCSTPGALNGTHSSEEVNEPNYSIIYMIHGDADYLYHDSLGAARQADEEVLKEAILLGKQAENGEVLIFHQRPERKILWLFPKKDRQFIYYRNGELIERKNYSPSGEVESGIFSSEARLLEEYISKTEAMDNSIFLYFGHEIPFKNGETYYRSIGHKNMNTGTFAEGIKSMIPETRKRFDLVVLSTCNNATPNMVHALQPLSRYLLASPQNLHLSHIDSRGLTILERDAGLDAGKVADKLSQETYNRLTNSVQTVVSLSIFDMNTVKSYVQRADSMYHSYLKSIPQAGPGTENMDCTDLPIFSGWVSFNEGVKSRYRPPLFGPKADRKSHSGWGCKE